MKFLKISMPILAGIIGAGMCLIQAQTAWADRIIKKDLDHDGLSDQLLIYNDAGVIQRVETDADHDGHAERVQIYREGRLVRLEQDTDSNGKTDCIDYIKNQKRICQKKFGPRGNPVQVTFFTDKGMISQIKKDTTGNGQFDTRYYFKDEKLVSCEKDTNGNGRTDVWTSFKNQVPAIQKQDKNEDGIMDYFAAFDRSE